MSALVSMTGFARLRGSVAGLDWVWELKSVNGRNLDVRFRLPPGFDGVEIAGRALVHSALRRGTIQASLTVSSAQQASSLRINRAALSAISEAMRAMESVMPLQPATADGIFRIKGVLEEDAAPELDIEARDAACLASLKAALEALVATRAEEGARLGALLSAHVARIESLCADAKALASLAPDAIRSRIKASVEKLLDTSSSFSPERLHQEAVLLAAKADVTEELDRLAAHTEQARGLIASGEAVGRRLDFLSQEFNREANTLCSKSFDIGLTRIGLDLKSTIEQFREQVQNVE